MIKQGKCCKNRGSAKKDSVFQLFHTYFCLLPHFTTFFNTEQISSFIKVDMKITNTKNPHTMLTEYTASVFLVV